jgi:hypothetical protein
MVLIFFTIVFTFFPICRLCFLFNCYYISVCNRNKGSHCAICRIFLWKTWVGAASPRAARSAHTLTTPLIVNTICCYIRQNTFNADIDILPIPCASGNYRLHKGSYKKIVHFRTADFDFFAFWFSYSHTLLNYVGLERS